MSTIIKKVRFAIDEAKEEMVREAETGGMWAATKRDDEPSAHESLQAILTTQQPDEHAGASTWGMSLFGKLPSASNLPTLFGKSQISSIKDWLRSFTAAGRAERIEQDWEEAVRRAYATHAFNDHMNELQVSRCRHNHGTSRTVSITLDSYQTVEQETSMPVDATTPASTAGSIWSNERVVYPQQPTERPASEINTPIVPQLKPTSRWPDGLHKYQAILSDPSFADVNYWASTRKPSRSELDSNTVPDEFNEITTSYSDGIKDYLPMKKSLSCIDKVDQCMKGSGEYVLFGRWRHHKDAPLSFVKDMIEKDLRGPGSNSLWGPGGLDIADHPLVCYYNERLRKLSQDESSNTDILEKAQLSPVLLNGRTSSQRSLLRSATPVTFNMTKDGVFQTTGFQQRTSSMGSTVESLSPQNTENIATNAQTDARRDSGVHGLQSNASPQAKHKNAQPATSVQYEVLRPYSPDPAVNMRLMNDASYKPEARKCEAWVSESYQKEFCGGVVVPEASQAPAGGDRHAARANTSRQRTQQPIKTQEEYDERERQAAYCLQKRGYEQQNQHAQAAGRERGPQPISRVQQQHIRAPAQRVASKQGKRVRSQTPGPQHRKVTLVPPEEAENAMWSDDEEADNVEELPKFNKLRQSEFGSPSPRGMLNKASLDNTSGTTTEKTERPVLATKRASAAESDSSSAASATVKDHAGLDTSADLSPCHTTPGTTASSGRGRKVKSPARAESLARRLADLDQNKGDDLDVPETRDEIEVQQQIIDN